MGGRADKDGDWTAGLARVGVPKVRTHGMGCVDMDKLWKPCSGGANTGCGFAGFDAWDDTNYDWTISDACVFTNNKCMVLPTLYTGHASTSDTDFSMVISMVMSYTNEVYSSLLQVPRKRVRESAAAEADRLDSLRPLARDAEQVPELLQRR